MNELNMGFKARNQTGENKKNKQKNPPKKQPR